MPSAVEHGNAQMREMRPERDLPRPHGCSNELWGDDERVAAFPVADEIGERRERGGSLAGAERRYQERGVALIEKCRSPILIGIQSASDGGRVHARCPPISVVLLFV